MQSYFNQIADFLTSQLSGEEVLTMGFSGEDSDFVRFNQSKVRQAGHVQQRYLELDLISGSRHAASVLTLSGVEEEDRSRATETVESLRKLVPDLPEDPHLLYATQVCSGEQTGDNTLPDSGDAVERILAGGAGRDLVGIYSAGAVYSGFANSLGQRNWFSAYSFNFDWSFYLRADKAVKSSYAGFEWDADVFAGKIDRAGEQLTALERDPRSIEPGRYRVYMTPVAGNDFIGLVGWGGYGLKAHRTKQTVLIRMMEEGASLSPKGTIVENTKEGVAPNFQGQGFLKPDQVALISAGALQDCLVSPRSAREYGVPTNGANDMEAPESLDMAVGDLPQEEVLARLDTGVYISNVWYLNFSDRPACRITGMTRFASFWVEGGRIAAPLDVMRFDETLYRAFGENLVWLTREREVILEAGTYGSRDTGSGRTPGALIEDFNFNL